MGGRFAPSPTGKLHFGSLVSALASFLDARHQNHPWYIRVEDIDPPREVPGSAQSILADLRTFGLEHDGEILYQSSRLDAYQEATTQLISAGKAFHCGCSRSELPAGGVYPGTCRYGLPPGKSPRAIRLKVSDEEITFTDRIQGEKRENLRETVGDFVIWRADGLPAYQLAVVVDDAFQQIDSIVRGADLLDSTARQIWLQRCLGLPQPSYAHVPLVLSEAGKKLSKRTQSDPLIDSKAPQALLKALEFLSQPRPAATTTNEILSDAVTHWDLKRINPL